MKNPTMIALLIALPACAQTTTEPIEQSQRWGVATGLHPDTSDRLGLPICADHEELRALGASSVLFPVPWAQSTIYSDDLRPSRRTISDHDLRQCLREAQASGLNVTLMPYVEIEEGPAEHWRGVIEPRDRAAWWRAHEAMLTHYAELAADEAVDLLVIGSELSSLATKDDRPRWERLTRRIRSIYPGPLAFSANHDALDRIAPFDFVDVLGVSGYWPLADTLDASEAQMLEAWRRIGPPIAQLRARWSKPVVLVEVGYPSVDGAATRPWDDTTGAPLDLEEQRRAYAALRRFLAEASYVEGAYAWGWYGPGGQFDRGYTPRGKPAEQELRALLLAQHAKPAE